MTILLALLILFTSLLIPASASAVTLDILSAPDSIFTSEFSITTQVTNAQAGINYLRIDIYKDGTSNYFGETNNGNEWYSGSDGTKYFPITITADQIATASIQGRFGNPSTGDYPGPGSYKMRVRRYTSSGNAGSTEQIPKDIQITVALPSPTPTPEPTPDVDPSPTPKASSSPSPTPKPTTKATPKATPKATTVTSTPTPESSGEVLSETTVVPSVNQSPDRESTTSGSIKLPMGIIFISIGIILSGGAGFLAYKQNQKQKLV